MRSIHFSSLLGSSVGLFIASVFVGLFSSPVAAHGDKISIWDFFSCPDKTHTVKVWYTEDGWAPNDPHLQSTDPNKKCQFFKEYEHTKGQCGERDGFWWYCHTDHCSSDWREPLMNTDLAIEEGVDRDLCPPNSDVPPGCGCLTLWGASSGSEKQKLSWEQPTQAEYSDARVSSSPAIDVERRLIYVTSSSRSANSTVLHAFDSRGNETWSADLGIATPGVIPSPTLGPDGFVYVAAPQGALLPSSTDRYAAYYKLDGSESEPTAVPALDPNGEAWHTSPVIDRHGTVFIAGSHGYVNAYKKDGDLAALALGELGESWTDPVIGRDGRVYLGDSEARLWAISWADDDELQAEVVFAAPGEYECVVLKFGPFKIWGERSTRLLTPVVDADGTTYLATALASDCIGTGVRNATGRIGLFAIDPGNETNPEIWFSAKFPTSSPVIDSDGAIYFGAGRHLVKLDSASGAQLGEYETAEDWLLGGPKIQTSAALSADDTVYFGSTDKRLYAVVWDEAFDRFVYKWSVATGGSIESSAAIGPDGRVFFGSDDGKLRAVYGSSPLAETAWPMFQRDLRHTKRPVRLLAVRDEDGGPAEVRFGIIPVGGSVSQTLTLENVGSVDVTIDDVQLNDAACDGPAPVSYTLVEAPETGLELPPLDTAQPDASEVSFDVRFRPETAGEIRACLVVRFSSIWGSGVTHEVPIWGKGGIDSILYGVVRDFITGDPIASATVALNSDLGDPHSTETDVTGSYSIEVPPGLYDVHVFVGDAIHLPRIETDVELGLTDSLEKDFDLYTSEAAGQIRITAIKPDPPGRVYYLHGVEHVETFEAEVDWGEGNPAGTVRFEWPGGDSTDPQPPYEQTLDPGSDFGACGKLKVQALDYQGNLRHEVEADFVVMPEWKWVFPGTSIEYWQNWKLVDLGESWYYSLNPIGNLFGPLGIEAPSGWPGMDSHDSYDFGWAPKIEVTLWSSGQSSQRYALPYFNKQIKRGDMAGDFTTHQARKSAAFQLKLRMNKKKMSKSLQKELFKGTSKWSGGGMDFTILPFLQWDGVFKEDLCKDESATFAEVTADEGYLGLVADVGYSKTFYSFAPPPIPIPVFLKLGAWLKMDGMLDVEWVDPFEDGGVQSPIQFNTSDAKLKIGPYVQATAGAGIDTVVAIEAWVGIGLDFYLEWNPDIALDKAILYGEGGIRAYALFFAVTGPNFRGECIYYRETENFDCTITGGWYAKESGVFRGTPVARDYLARRSDPTHGADDTDEEPPTVPGVEAEEVHAQIFPYPEPALSSSFLLYLHDYGDRAAFNRTEVVYRTWDALEGWSDPAPIDVDADGNDDGTADFHPALLELPGGQAFAAWEDHIKVLEDPDPASADYRQRLDDLWETMRQLDISVSIYDPQEKNWSESQRFQASFDDEDHFDHAPRLDGRSSDDVMLVWVANAADEIQALPDAPDSLWFVMWNGQTWSAPEQIAEIRIPNDSAENEIGVPLLQYDIAYDGTRGYIVMSLDTDGNGDTSSDRELFVLRYSGATGAWGDVGYGEWSALERLTDDGETPVADDGPQLAVRPDGSVVLAWVREVRPELEDPDDLLPEETVAVGHLTTVNATEQSDWFFAMDVQTVAWEDDLSANLSDFALCAHGSKLAVVWGQASETASDLVVAFYDDSAPETDLHVWSSPTHLTADDQKMKRQIVAALRPDGALSAVYASTEIELREVRRVTETGEEIVVVMPDPTIPTASMTDEDDAWALRSTGLTSVRYRTLRDLEILENGFWSEPAKPLPGQQATFTIEIMNVGDVAVKDVPVRVARGAETIAAVTIEDAIESGDLIEVELTGVVPDQQGVFELLAQLDFEDDNAANNELRMLIGLPDLTLRAPTWEQSEGGLYLVQAVVENLGATSAETTRVTFRRASYEEVDDEVWQFVCSDEVLGTGPGFSAEPGESHQAELEYVRTETDHRSIAICVLADEDNLVPESNENNNEWKLVIPINNPPVAVAGEDRSVECTGELSATVSLDGSGSTDPDCRPGTQDDLERLEWFQEDQSLGLGDQHELELPLGSHEFTLVATDRAGETDSAPVTITVEDTTPPSIAIAPSIEMQCTSPSGAAVDLGSPAITDVCCTDGITSSSDAPEQFAIGKTNVEWMATDCSGNSRTVVQEVSVTDPDRYYSIRGYQSLAGITRRGAYFLRSKKCVTLVDEFAQSILPSRAEIDALDVQPDGTVTFSLEAHRAVTHGGGYTYLRREYLYRFDPATAAIELLPGWEHVGRKAGNVIAVDVLENAQVIFAVEALRGFHSPAASITLRPGNLYRLDPATGAIELLWDGRANGLKHIDAVDLLPDGKIAFSVERTRFVSTPAGGHTLRPQNVYIFDPATGLITVAFDGRQFGIRTLDAITLEEGRE